MGIFIKKVPFIEQMTQAECGLSCVAMILRYNKSYESLQDLRDYLDTGRDGNSIKQLVELFDILGFDCNVYKSDVKQLYKANLPAIILFESNHYVILESITRSHVRIVDPSCGSYKIPVDDIGKKFSNIVLEALPNEKFSSKKRDRWIWKDILGVVLHQKKLLFNLLISSIVIYFIGIGFPVLIKNIIDGVQSLYGANLKILLSMVLCFVILNVLLLVLRNIFLIKFRVAVDYGISSIVVRKLLDVSYHFFEIRKKADLLITINGGYVLREIFAMQFVSGIIDFGAIFVIGIYLYKQSVVVFAISVTLFIFNALYLCWSRPLITDENRQLLNQQGRREGKQIELLYSILGVKMAGIEREVYRNWDKVQTDYLCAYSKNEYLKNKLAILTSLLTIGSPMLVLCVCVKLFVTGNLTMGGVMSLYTISASFFSLSGSVSNMYNSYVNSLVYLERIKDILTFEKDEKDKLEFKQVLKGNICLENISFSYSKHSKNVIKSVSLNIKEGQKVAIVGKSGSGKSTLGKLFIGLYKPKEGEIYLDGKILSKYDASCIRRQMGIVPQDVTLFNRSIAYNIGMGREDVTQEMIEEAAQLARIHDDIVEMPMRYNTIISDMGTNFSGGQRQRIVLARAIVKKPKLIVLDEATSSLDSYNETLILDYFKKNKCTVVIIAHRLSTIQDSDIIIVMDDGKVVATGRHEELLKYSNTYELLYGLGSCI